MNAINIETMAMGKIPMSFLDYELVVENAGNYLRIVSINIVHKGKILNKIKPGTKMLRSADNNIHELVQQIIIQYLKNGDANLRDVQSGQNTSGAITSKKQKTARMQAAESLFSEFNL